MVNKPGFGAEGGGGLDELSSHNTRQACEIWAKPMNTRGARMVYVALRASRSRACVALENLGFHHLTLSRRNYHVHLRRPSDRMLEPRRRNGMALSSDLLTADEEELAEHYPNRVEHTADSIVHAVGILAALVGGGLLVAIALVNRGVPMATAGAIYAMCLMAMLAASAVYNLTKPFPVSACSCAGSTKPRSSLMIAGSYTPFTIKLLPPDFRCRR